MNKYDPERKLIVRVPASVERGRVADMLVSALEGGSTYWLSAIKLRDGDEWPEGCEYMSDCIASGLVRWVFYTDDDPIDTRYPENSVPMALQLLAEQFPRHWLDFFLTNDDADTADIFFQLMCFGEVIYG